jgi:hypothetical protein
MVCPAQLAVNAGVVAGLFWNGADSQGNSQTPGRNRSVYIFIGFFRCHLLLLFPFNRKRAGEIPCPSGLFI